MFENIKWLFFDVGSTIVDEHIAYEHRMREIAVLANMTYETIYKISLEFYKNNKKGDLETAKLLKVGLPDWHTEDEVLYSDASQCLEVLSRHYKIGIIANQSPGTRDRLEQYGILKYIDMVAASAEEGVAKPDKEIFEIALKRSNCKPYAALMVGDRIDNDIVPANLLGMHTIRIMQGFGQYWNIKSKIEEADCTVNNLAEILNILPTTALSNNPSEFKGD